MNQHTQCCGAHTARYLKYVWHFPTLRVKGLTNKVVSLIKHQSYHNIETSQSIYCANQLHDFYLIATLAFNELMSSPLS